MTSRFCCCISGLLLIIARLDAVHPGQSTAGHAVAPEDAIAEAVAGAVLEQDASQQALPPHARQLMRLEKDDSARVELGALVSEAEEQTVGIYHNDEQPSTTAFPGEMSEAEASDIKGEMQIMCGNPSAIYLSVEALSIVQNEIARVAQVNSTSVTTYFKGPAASLLATSHSSLSSSRRATVDVTFYISVPPGTDADPCRKAIMTANKTEITSNLGSAFLELGLVNAENEVSVATFLAHEEEETLMGPMAKETKNKGEDNFAAEMASHLPRNVLLLLTCSAIQSIS